MAAAPIRIAALYRFARFPDPAALQAPLLELCREHGIKGTLLLAGEGINGTVAGSPAAIDALLAHVRTLPGCTDPEVKFADADAMPFHRMKVRLKREIVTMGEPAIDPLAGVGHYVAPQDWNALVDDPGTILIDTRNDYEVAIGTFARSEDPGTASFAEFPAWLRARKAEIEESGETPRIAMFCTGGIRCEKSTAFARGLGLEEVYHLKGGILAYLEQVPAEDSRWHGECFVFDERVAVGHALAPGSHTLCRACRMPLSEADRASHHFEEGIACPHCHDVRSEHDRARYAERQKQEALAASRGTAHVGAKFA